MGIKDVLNKMKPQDHHVVLWKLKKKEKNEKNSRIITIVVTINLEVCEIYASNK